MIEWQTSTAPVDYEQAIQSMEDRIQAIRDGSAPELVWLLEHPPLYTAGTSAKAGGLLDAARFPVYATGRGGEYTYHGPGQRIAYVMLDLKKHGQDVRGFVRNLENWVIATLAEFGVESGPRPGRVGVWVDRGTGRDDKIAAIGVRVRKWVTFHGISINVNPDLSHYTGIVPCGISDHGVTSLADLGIKASMEDVDAVLKARFTGIFAPQ